MHPASILFVVFRNHLAQLLVERTAKSRQRNDGRVGIHGTDHVQQLGVFFQIGLHGLGSVVGAVVDQNVIGLRSGNGRAVKIVGVRLGGRGNLSASRSGGTNGTVSHKDGAQIQRLCRLPRIGGANVILIATVALIVGGNKIGFPVVKIYVNENALGDGIAYELNGLSLILGKLRRLFHLHAEEGNLSRQGREPTAILLGTALVNDAANMLARILGKDAKVGINGHRKQIAAIQGDPKMETGVGIGQHVKAHHCHPALKGKFDIRACRRRRCRAGISCVPATCQANAFVCIGKVHFKILLCHQSKFSSASLSAEVSL